MSVSDKHTYRQSVTRLHFRKANMQHDLEQDPNTVEDDVEDEIEGLDEEDEAEEEEDEPGAEDEDDA